MLTLRGVHSDMIAVYKFVMDQNETQKENATRAMLNQISPSFCTVKWRHATMNIGSGAVKSCCHLPFRKIDLESLSAGDQLHDTKADRSERQQMLNGERPKNCSYCWWLEDNNQVSNRISWSSKSWMPSDPKPTIEQNKNNAAAPSWLELNFSNVCNLKCSYCSPIFSSKWLQEIKEFGPYPTSPKHNDVNYLQGVELNEKYDNTKLLEQFWPWFNRIYDDLRLLKITGGEPLLSSHTFRVLREVIDRDNAKLNLSINSNLSVPEANWAQFIDLAKQIYEKKQSKFYLHPSIDTYGPRAEYIRHGLNFDIFRSHVEDYLTQTNGHIVFICTLNNLSLGGLTQLWQYMLDLKKRFGPRGQWISITTEVLMGPEWQNLNILPTEFQQYLIDTITFAKAHQSEGLNSFSAYEIQGLVRALDMMRIPNAKLPTARKNFYKFFSEHDRRRKTDFIKTFPELREFYLQCGSNLNDSLHAQPETEA